MRKVKGQPSWWLLYLLVLGTIGLLALEARAHLSERGHQLAAIGTLLLVWVMVELWLRANAVALLREHQVVLVPRPRPNLEEWTRDDDCEPSLTPPRLAQDVGEPWAADGALALQEKDTPTC